MAPGRSLPKPAVSRGRLRSRKRARGGRRPRAPIGLTPSARSHKTKGPGVDRGPTSCFGRWVQAVAALGEAAAARTLSKHELQYTGRSVLGENGTTAWPPHSAQIAA
jgi:hypothetical protein